MATVTNILLLILTVRCAIVLSQDDSTQRTNDFLPGSIAQQLEFIVGRQMKLLKKVLEQDAVIEQLQLTFRELQAEFDCHFSPCQSSTCIYL